MSKINEPFKVIAFAGPAGVGKTTIAHAFSGVYNGKILSFAKPLKQSLSVLTGLPPKYFDKIELKEKQIPGLTDSPRTLMQKFGTEFVRDMVHPNFWIWRMKNLIDKEKKCNIIIDDVRFDNEAQFIRDYGGILIHLEREFNSPTVHIEHASEKLVVKSYGDYTVAGDSVRDTYTQCKKCLEDFYGS